MALTKVTRSGITDDSINADKIEDGTIVDADITPGTITNAKLAGSIANDKLANSSLTINGSSVSLGGTSTAGSIDWQSVVVSDGSTVTTMVAGKGYFIDNTSAAGIVRLPSSASAGDTIAIKDYAGNFNTNNLTIERNSHKIQGNTNDSLINTDRASVSLVYVDATKGWLYSIESNVTDFGPSYMAATGGTVTTSGNFKVHVFTGDGCFVVSQVGANHPTAGKVDYLVVAGGGGMGGDGGGGGGAGGFRTSNVLGLPGPTTSPLASPSGLTLTAATFPISVGAGGAGGAAGNAPAGGGANGSNAVFSTITSTGGGRASCYADGSPYAAGNGGSGGGGSRHGSPTPGGNGNTPPVSPPQGNNGGTAAASSSASAGGGGAAAAGGGVSGCGDATQGAGGIGSFISTCFSTPGKGTPGPVSGTRYFAGGGGGGGNPGGPTFTTTGGAGGGGAGGASGTPGVAGNAGTANTGGGAGGGGNDAGGYAGGKGIVIIRYQFQGS
jgi:hypothetical protein